MEFSVYSDVPRSGGKRCAHRIQFSGVREFARRLAEVPPVAMEWSPWWSPHVWKANCRLSEDWESSCMIAFDLDYEPEPKKHSPLPDSVRELVLRNPPTFCNCWHFSPRGMRLFLLLSAECRDRAAYSDAARGAATIVEDWLSSIPGSGLKNDPTVYKDFARLLYPPNGRIVSDAGSTERSAEVRVERDAPYVCAQLVSLAPKAQAPLFARGAPAAGSDEGFAKALSEYNARNARDWGRPGANRCPFHPDAGGACFGRLPTAPDKWCCWSSNHPDGYGHRSEDGTKFVGDAADVDAFMQGKSVFELVTGRKPSESVMSDSEAAAIIGDWSEAVRGANPTREKYVKKVGFEHEAVDHAEMVMAENGVFSRAGGCVRVVDGEMVPVRLADAQLLLGRCVEWQRKTPDGKTLPWDPSEAFCRQVVGRSCFRYLKPLDVVSRVPVLLPDGTFVKTPGYSDRTGVFFWPDGEWGDLPERTTKDEARRCMERLLFVVSDFPFKTDADKATWLAGLLTPACRRLYSGNTPLFSFSSTTPGTGKTLLVKIISKIISGRPLPVSRYNSDPNEMQKELLSLLLAGQPMRLFDNVRGEVKSMPLEAVLTSGGQFAARILGKSQDVSVPVSTAFYLTGNNVTFGGDLYRRVLMGELEPDTDRPEARDDFQIEDIEAFVGAHQRELYVCAARMAQAWIQSGRPVQKKKAFGSFEQWSIVRDILIWLGMPDVCRTEDVHAVSTPEMEAHELVLGALRSICHKGPMTLFQIVSRVNSAIAVSAGDEDGIPWDYADLVEGFRLVGAMERGGRAVDTAKASYYFRSIAGRWCGDLRLKRGDTKAKGGKTLWEVESKQAPR